MSALDSKINSIFAGKVVRKDLTSIIKGNAVVPTYVLEYLLGQYCATDDEQTINNGINLVKDIIAQHFVHRDESEIVKSMIREKSNHRIIDKISVKLNDKLDRYEANLTNIGLNRIPINDSYIKDYPKLLSEGVWALINISYQAIEERNSLPWIIEGLKPIQISNIDINEYKELRDQITKDEWIDLLMQTIGLNPTEFTYRSKLIQLSRLIPYAENNYNLIELGPKGTGKSHIYSELSPHGILISGGEVSKAKLFVNNTTGEIGLVGYWDVVAYDEFAGKSKNTDRGLVDILKNYMAQKSFSRGTNVYQAEASMVFVGNTDHSVNYMIKHTNLFDALPKDYYDTAFLDRIHCYIPGWEVKKLRSDMFSSSYGFIVDYLAEVLKAIRKEDYSKLYQEHFELSPSLTTRDKTAIEKTFSGLVKIIYPNGKLSRNDVKELLDFSVECRKRVKDQLVKMDETFKDDNVRFEYNDKDGTKYAIETLENIHFNVPSENTHVKLESEENETIESENQIYLKPKHLEIRDNQTNISYDLLFGEYLKGAKNIKIVDPYIRLPYQIKNLMELLSLITTYKRADESIRIHLQTYNEDEFIEQSSSAFRDLTESLIDQDIDFTFSYNETIHDRYISLDTGWKIILGRGLDIWQKVFSRYDLSEHYQNSRLCKEFSMTIIKE